MSQETSYINHMSYHTPNKGTSFHYENTTPQQKYSSPNKPSTQRRYATLEESEAVIPVFTTPTNMYLWHELNPQPRYTSSTQRPTYSPQKNYPNPPKHYSTSASFDPLVDKKRSSAPSSYGSSSYEKTRGESTSSQYHASPHLGSQDASSSPRTSNTNTSTTADMLLAQLVDMGFSLENAKVAVAATGGNNLQDALDILIQNTQTASPKKAPAEPKDAPLSSDDDEDLEKEREQEALWKQQQEERRKEYLDQLKRNKPTPPTPKQSDPVTSFAEKERKQGNYLFNKNRFEEAEAAYSLAIGSLPTGHGDLVLLSNNRAAARLKQSKYHDCLADCAVAIDLARKHIKSGTPQTTLMTEASTTMKAQLTKALHRKACALEGLCLFEAAIQFYEEYVRLEGSRSTQVSQGIMRCQQAILEQKKNKKANQPSWKPANNNASAFPDIDFNMFIPKTSQPTQAELDEINSSKAVQEMREREKKKEAEDAEKAEKQDKVNAQIAMWKTGKENNLRALLSSLESILWSGVQWKSVMMSELVEPKKCKITYMKAIAKVHPDKVSSIVSVLKLIFFFKKSLLLMLLWNNVCWQMVSLLP
ncbi:uncharacterized protein B0P05DRAFT_524234 [Gilbertella persicaria]|uniref:uncharacterized protein n=1 Tax=Gilbertella persicaria TaxID=101096 RepID=UPI002221269D|nr:uncharacterized protein B0P05DRAFT_524234 [Gilbertella persicaria]KAI8094997.1 hypothetical protein B0P05DRAFT_524234 [Gilbertella persicaria]